MRDKVIRTETSQRSTSLKSGRFHEGGHYVSTGSFNSYEVLNLVILILLSLLKPLS